MPGLLEKADNEYFGMSDEDFLNLNSPAAPASVPAEGAADVVAGAEEAASSNTQAEAQGDSGKTSEETGAAVDEAGVADGAVEIGENKIISPAPTQESTEGKKPDPAAEPGKPTEADKPAQSDKPEVTAPDFEAFYKQIMTPFKANGRTFEPKTPEEAIRLMQMGAGYGRKIQELQPHLKVLRMLEKNDLLDESKLSFLIDINQKNPDAIKKIIKDSGMDPLDMNIEDNASYVPKNHAVSDKEMAFQTALKDVQSHPQGTETIRLINQTWDQESKSVLWDQPDLFGVIQSQRDTGIYDQIAAEIDRQKILGMIGLNTPFLQAYKIAGDFLQANNGFKVAGGQSQQIQNQSGNNPQPQVIATRQASPKASVQNGDKAAAASPTKGAASTKTSATTVNPLEVADDVFMKQFNGRF